MTRDMFAHIHIKIFEYVAIIPKHINKHINERKMLH